ncbi:peptide chain release factor N(5)-glutamine methyltransferase [Salisaeta longa]|uniref:peptide chain release factor N(5)-glutamine methyltransferase n=1 Tax=Salisaeta longa TaxID=503170 RepID=UPI0003B40E26|nr:peptide chain release factor N(5)-glutamine methyltransferase [Salisaeta longa]
MPTRRALLNEATQHLTAAACEQPRRTAVWLLADLLSLATARLLAFDDATVPPEQAARYRTWVRRRAAGEPLQHIVGHVSFCGLRIAVSPAVLIPRPETEEVVQAALARIDDRAAPRILDVGTGSGCIALACKHKRPDAQVTGVDVSASALAVARRNAARLDLSVALVEADARAASFPNVVPGGCDLLVSNPPYIPDAEAHTLDAVVRDYDPALALFAGDDPLTFYRCIAQHAATVLASGGWCVFETHADFATGVADVLRAHGFTGVAVQHDLGGRPRVAAGQRPQAPKRG